MIVKNEEAHLERCLASVRGLVDDIVIVDTGSTDRTMQIARSAGACVHEMPWADDFSLVRNAGLDRAAGEWILVLDADESIAGRDHAAIRACVDREDEDLDAVIVRQRHYVWSTPVGWEAGSGGYEEGLPYPGFFASKCRRLFRNRPWLRFRGVVHEAVVPTDPSRPLREIEGSWVIHHFGKADAADRVRAKGEAYLRLGAKKADEQPEDPQAHYELGVQHATLGRDEAALACFARVDALHPGFREVAFQSALCHARLGHHDRALTALEEAARTLPDHQAAIAAQEGIVHRSRGDFGAAEQAFDRAIDLAPAFAAAHVGLAFMYSLQGQPERARAALDRGLAACPQHPDLWLERARQRFAGGDDHGALADLEAAGTTAASRILRARILLRQRQFDAAASCLEPADAACDPEQQAAMAALRGSAALGLGRIDDAIAQLRCSLALTPAYEAARNLCTALDAASDALGACEAAAEALRLGPDDAWAVDRFRSLAGRIDVARAPVRGDRPLTIFFAQPRSPVYDGTTPRERGLGGTESAVVYLAEALARRGHRVTVLNACESPGVFGGVKYARWESLPLRCLADRPDVLVGVRDWRFIGGTRLAPLQVFWTGDAADQPSVAGLADASARREIDLFMLQSEWQAAAFQARHDLRAWQIVKTRLGSAASSAPDAAVAAPAGSRRRRLAYISTPFRGLDVLLELFPRIRAACPDAELDVFSSMAVYGVSAADDERAFGELYVRARQPGVRVHGSLPQPELTARLREARVLAYPNHFPETFCVAAVEAQAAGCPVITSDLGALAETVGEGGICIPGDPRSPAYQRAFVDACVALIVDDQVWAAASARATERAKQYAWPDIAAHWERTCRLALVDEPSGVERMATHVSGGRDQLAIQMWTRTARPPGAEETAWEALGAVLRWHARQGPRPDAGQLREVALGFRSFRSDECLGDGAARGTVGAGAVA